MPFFIALASVVLYLSWHFAQVHRSVIRWAASRRFKLLAYHRLFLPPWPPALVIVGTWKSQVLLSIRVYDESTHRIRNGWLRLGSPWWGLLDADAAEVFWADE